MAKIGLSEGTIGNLHGTMHERVRNPFKSEFMRANYDAAIKTYDDMHPSFIYENGRRCLGSTWAGNFWRGFDGIERNWDAASKQSAAYAMWCAGRDIKVALIKSGEFKPESPDNA